MNSTKKVLRRLKPPVYSKLTGIHQAIIIKDFKMTGSPENMELLILPTTVLPITVHEWQISYITRMAHTTSSVYTPCGVLLTINIIDI
jgi:hypothetical protein